MANTLPDEIISEILSPALKVSDDAFSDTSRVSPFSLYSESSSAFLVVSKAWLRVATPLLYHVVVLRSKAQARALDIALRNNQDLGRFIKKLRVEGGYGNAMQKIIQAAPNITHLYLTLIVWASDNVSGLCQGLPSMNPTRVVLFDVDYRKSNKNTQFLRDTLEQCISKWKNLAIFELPYRNDTFHSSPSSMAIASALSKAPNLKTLVIPHSHLVSRAPAHLVVIAKNSSLQNIRFKRPVGGYYNASYYASSPSVNASLRGLLQTPEEDPETSIDIPIHPNPSLKPVQFSTVSVTEDIWKRILDFAMVLDVENQPLNTRFPYRLGPVLVSKTFAKLALPYLYETLIFRTPFALNDFSAKLTTNPSLGPLVRTLYLDTLAQVNIRPKILPNTKLVNLIALLPFNISPKAFSDLAKFSGPTLTRLEGLQVTKSSRSKPENPFILARFSRIRSLSLVMKTSFDTSPTISPSTLATLERLRLSNFDTSFLSILSQLDLPALRHVDFAFGAVGDEGFFDKHGSKLQTVTLSVHQAHRLAIFNRCPAVVHLTLLCGHDLPIPSSFTCAINHMHLEKVSFDTNLRGRGTERKWGVFFQSLNVSTFPALREIQVPCIVWPTTEHNITKSLWVKWADGLLDQNVRLANDKGVNWRRRLKK